LVVRGANKVSCTSGVQHIALFGGSFDPPHLGHQALVEAALQQLKPDELWIIPVGLAVHRDLSGKTSPAMRLLWLQEMFAKQNKVKIWDWEVKNTQSTPTIATLHHFKALHPHIIPTWLMGLDAYLALSHWVGYPEHQQLCNIAVFKRHGYEDINDYKGWKPISPQSWQHSPPQQAGHVLHLEVDLPTISSSEIRAHAHQYQHQLAQSTCKAILACYA